MAGALEVSLTRYPARIAGVHRATGAILGQAVLPAKTVLYLDDLP